MSILAPKITLNILGAQQISQGGSQRALLVGQQISGSATAGAVSTDVPADSLSIEALFGAKSHIAEMVKKFKAVNKNTPLDVLPLADGGGAVKAASTITVGGTATEDGSIVVYAMGKTNYRATVTITSGDAAAAVAAAIETAMNAVEAKWPFVTTSATVVATITASNGGTLYNGAPIGVIGLVAGLTFTLAAFTSGATDPALTSIFDAVGNVRYQTIGWPAVYATTEIEGFLNARFNDEFEVLDGIGVLAKTDTAANLSGGPSENSQSLVYIADKLIDEGDRKGPASQNLADHKTAVFCAIRSLRLTEDASLTGILTTVASSDQFGGNALASLPYHNTAMPEISVPLPQDEFTLTQVRDLTDDGYTIASANKAFNAVILGRTVTTYKTNVAGDPDTSFKYLNRVDTSSKIREVFVANYRVRYAQSRLTNGELLSGRDMANEASIRAFSKRIYGILADDALVEKGSISLRDFDENLSIVLSISEGKATINMAPLQVGQLRTIIGTVAVNFSS